MGCVPCSCTMCTEPLSPLTMTLLQFVAVLEGVLCKLSRYDEGTFFSSILSFTVSISMSSPVLPFNSYHSTCVSVKSPHGDPFLSYLR